MFSYLTATINNACEKLRNRDLLEWSSWNFLDRDETEMFHDLRDQYLHEFLFNFNSAFLVRNHS